MLPGSTGDEKWRNEPCLTEGPAVGCGDGTLLVGWPCRIAPPFGAHDSPFNIVPVMVWTSGQTATAVVMLNDGRTETHPVNTLQFDPKWSPNR